MFELIVAALIPLALFLWLRPMVRQHTDQKRVLSEDAAAKRRLARLIQFGQRYGRPATRLDTLRVPSTKQYTGRQSCLVIVDEIEDQFRD